MREPHAAAAGAPRVVGEHCARNRNFGILTQKRPFRKATPYHAADRPNATRTEARTTG
jgi:hypothetical protein